MLTRFISMYLFLAVLLLSFLFVYTFERGRSTHSKAMGMLSLCLQFYILGYLLEINSSTLSDMIFWNMIQYIGIPFFPAFWLIISLLYTGHDYLIKGKRIIIVFIIPVLTFFMRLTNEYHYLFYKSYELHIYDNFKSLYITKGPFYLVQMAYVFISIILSTWFYFKRFRKSEGNEKVQFSLLVYASIIPSLALILVYYNFGGIGIDYSALILPICIFLINLALMKYNFLDIKNLVRERVFEDSSLGLIILNRINRVVDFNDKSLEITKLFGFTLKEGSLNSILTNSPDVLECIESNGQSVFHRVINDSDRYVKVDAKEMMNKSEVVGKLVVLDDVTETEILKHQLLEMANTDVLSGLNNRRRFRECAEDAHRRALRYNEPLSVLMMDIDLFKRINDTYGHVVGDYVIQSFSNLLKTNFRTTDIIGRMGGEEFAVVLVNCDVNLAYAKAEHFRNQVERLPMEFDNYTVNVNVSIGIATLDNDSHCLDTLINHADHALYDAKKQGRNRSIIWNNNELLIKKV